MKKLKIATDKLRQFNKTHNSYFSKRNSNLGTSSGSSYDDYYNYNVDPILNPLKTVGGMAAGAIKTVGGSLLNYLRGNSNKKNNDENLSESDDGKNTYKKVGRDPNFIDNADESVKKLKSGDSIAVILGKMYILQRKSYDKKEQERELNISYRKEEMDEDERRHKKIIDALINNKKEKPEEEKKQEGGGLGDFIKSIVAGVFGLMKGIFKGLWKLIETVADVFIFIKNSIVKIFGAFLKIGKVLGAMLKVMGKMGSLLSVFNAIKLVFTGLSTILLSTTGILGILFAGLYFFFDWLKDNMPNMKAINQQEAMALAMTGSRKDINDLAGGKEEVLDALDPEKRKRIKELASLIENKNKVPLTKEVIKEIDKNGGETKVLQSAKEPDLSDEELKKARARVEQLYLNEPEKTKIPPQLKGPAKEAAEKEAYIKDNKNMLQYLEQKSKPVDPITQAYEEAQKIQIKDELTSGYTPPILAVPDLQPKMSVPPEKLKGANPTQLQMSERRKANSIINKNQVNNNTRTDDARNRLMPKARNEALKSSLEIIVTPF